MSDGGWAYIGVGNGIGHLPMQPKVPCAGLSFDNLQDRAGSRDERQISSIRDLYLILVLLPRACVPIGPSVCYVSSRLDGLVVLVLGQLETDRQAAGRRQAGRQAETKTVDEPVTTRQDTIEAARLDRTGTTGTDADASTRKPRNKAWHIRKEPS